MVRKKKKKMEMEKEKEKVDDPMVLKDWIV